MRLFLNRGPVERYFSSLWKIEASLLPDGRRVLLLMCCEISTMSISDPAFHRFLCTLYTYVSKVQTYLVRVIGTNVPGTFCRTIWYGSDFGLSDCPCPFFFLFAGAYIRCIGIIGTDVGFVGPCGSGFLVCPTWACFLFLFFLRFVCLFVFFKRKKKGAYVRTHISSEIADEIADFVKLF